MLKNKLMYKYLTIFVFTHYAIFPFLLFLYKDITRSHTYTHLEISIEQNAARQFIIFTLLKFSSRDEGDIKQLQQRAAQAVGRGKPKLAGEDTKQQGCQNIRKRRSRAQKERRASSSKTLA